MYMRHVTEVRLVMSVQLDIGVDLHSWLLSNRSAAAAASVRTTGFYGSCCKLIGCSGILYVRHTAHWTTPAAFANVYKCRQKRKRKTQPKRKRKRKEKATLLGMIQEQLVVNPSFPYRASIERGEGGGLLCRWLVYLCSCRQ